jgi:hypothetical protein
MNGSSGVVTQPIPSGTVSSGGAPNGPFVVVEASGFAAAQAHVVAAVAADDLVAASGNRAAWSWSSGEASARGDVTQVPVAVARGARRRSLMPLVVRSSWVFASGCSCREFGPCSRSLLLTVDPA